MLRIRDNRDETPSIRTVRFGSRLDAVPGQFVMVWVPGIDEFPMSISYTGTRFGITYQVLGDGTRALASVGPGDYLGIRGPYGRGFELTGKRLLLVAGGAGMAPLAPMVKMAVGAGKKVDLVIGARTRAEILFDRRASRAGARVFISTDDGSRGFKGIASELAEDLLSKSRYDAVYACGPEKMISKLLGLAREHRVPMQASLERIMKCGIGLCDSCAIDGRHVCTDGPVFSDQEMKLFEDLGRSKLDLTGRRVPI
ncbi:MAG: dihydroorotate dehydrogenase electron transfer subunit [Euryarchaeota archaeon RBG_16_62_10]|nr:MAG: dihydroorotate dehydrogenase electron transfer subunit [Euryarchaeota archaeon RBG_16_62_10]